MYFNRKNAEQKNWRMIKKGKHFLFGCSLVFAVGATLVAPSVKADTVEAKPEASTTPEVTKPVSAEENPTYAAPAVEVAPVVATGENAEKAETTQNSNEEPVVATDIQEADSIQTPEVTVVYNPSALTDEEKAKVVAAVKAANPTATDVQVQADGSVVVTFADGSRANLSAAQTIKDGSLVAKPRTKRAPRTTAPRASEGAENLEYTNKKRGEVVVDDYIKISYEVDNAKNVIHWTTVVNGGRVGNAASGYTYFTVPKDSVGTPTNWKIEQTDKNGKVMSTRTDWKNNDGSYVMGAKGKTNVYTGDEMTKKLAEFYKNIGNPALKGKEAEAAAQAAARSQALYTLTADVAGGWLGKNPSWTITYDTPILDKSKPLDYIAGLQGTGGAIGAKTEIMTGYMDNFIDNASSKFQAVAVKEKYTAKVGGSFAADPATYVTNKAGTPEFPNNYRGATTFAWKDGQAPTATEAGTYTKTVVVTYPAHYKQAPQEVTITFEVEGEKPSKPVVDTDLTGKAGTKDPVVVTADPGTKVELFDKDGNKIGEATAGTDGKATITPTVDIPAGNVTATATKDGQTSDASDPMVATATPAKPSKPVVDTDLTGKAGTKDPVVVTADPGTKVELFDKDGNKIGEATAGTDGKATITPTVDIPAGNVTATATKDGQTSDASDPMVATATPAKPSKPVVDTDLTGKAGTKDPVVVTADPGTKVELFDKDGNKIGEATAGTDGKATITPTVDIPAGNVTATATKDGQTSDASDPMVATATPAKPSKPVVDTDLTGKAGTKDPVVVTADPGTKVELFDKDGNKIGEATAGTDGKATITPTVDIPAGNVTATATKDGQTSDASDPMVATATPAKPSKPVVDTDLTGKAGTKDPVVVTADPGTKVELFDKDGNKIGEATAGTDGKATITPTVDIPAGNVTATATKDGQTSDASDPMVATATPAKPSKPVVDTDLTGKAGTKDPVVVTADPGTKVELFDKDGNKIGEATAGTDGKATITPTVDIPAGNVTATATKDGQTSDASDPMVATATPAKPSKPVVDTDLTGKAGTKDPVVVTADPGTKVELFDKDGNKIGEATAGTDGKATITPTVDIPAGNVTATATKDGQTSDASDPMVATATPAKPSKPVVDTDLTGKAGTKDPVVVTADPGTKVELFDKDGNKIGEATAGTDGKATITPTVDIPAGNVTATATKDGQTSDASDPMVATATPAKPSKPVVDTDLTGKAGTKDPVVVTADPGTKVELFDKDGNKIGEATAGTDGKATITPTVDIPAGNVTATATKDGQTSDASDPMVATATPAKPSKPVVDTDLTGKAGTKDPVVVTADPGTKVELFDKDGNKIGEATAGTDGKATITPTVDIPAGNVTATATKDGQTSDASDPMVATATPAKPSKPVVDTDLTGKAGTKDPVVVTADPGTKVELFDKDGNKIGEATAGTDGKATITPTVDIPAGNVTATATKDGQTSDASDPMVATATPAKPSKPVVDTDLTGKAGTKDPVVVTADPGTKVELFDKDGNKIGEATAGTDGKATITPTVDIPAGNVTATATKDGQTSDASDPMVATATPAKPSKPVVDTDLTGKAGTKDPVVVTADPGTKVELFDKDGNKIGEATAGTDGKATITPTVDIPAGNVTATATKDGQTSDASDPMVATATPAKPSKPVVDTDLTGKAGTKDPVVVTADPGTKVELFDKDGNKIGEATAGTDGKATITPTVDIPAGNVTATATKDGQTSDASDPMVATATPAKPSKPVVDTDLTGKAGTKDPVVVTADPGTKVELFDKDGNKIGEATAGTDGKATITPTVDIPAGNVTATATKDGQTSDASDPMVATATPAKPSKPVVDTDLTGKAGTKDPVVVTADPGTKVELFDKDGNKIGEATAGTDGKATITPTVDIPAGNVTATATKDGQTSDASDPMVATATPAKPSKPVVDTDLTGKAGTKDPVVVTADPGTKVELFDKDGNKIGEATAGTDGKATITPTVDIPAGNVTATATKDGQTSDASDPMVATATPAKPSKPVVDTDLTGKAGTKDPVVVTADPGTKVELFDKDGNKIGEATAGTDGKATITPTVDIPAGNVTATATKDGQTSDASDPMVATATPAKPSKPVVDTDLTGKAGTKDPVVVTADPGTKVELFDKDGNKIGEATAGTDGKATITPTVDIPAGNVTATATKDGQTSDASDPMVATATPAKPSKPVVDTDLTGKAGTKDPVVVTADPGTKVELFDKDGNKIGEATAGTDGKATITPTVDIPAGNVTATATKDGQTSDASDPMVATATPAKPSKPVVDTDLTGKAGTKDPVVVTADPGTKVELFDKDGNKIGEATAGTDGKATITPTVDIPAGNVTATATKDGQTSDASDPMVATATPAKPSKPVVDTDLTGKAGTKDPVVVTADPGTKVELFDKDGNKIGEATAGTDGKATITPTVDIPAGNVTATATKDGQTSDASDPMVATATPAKPSKPVVDTDLTGKAGTKDPVVVTADPGTKVELFDKDGNKIGEATAGTDGKATITPTVDIPAGNVTATATKDGQTSDASDPMVATATPAKPSKPVVDTDLTGKAGTKDPVVVTADPGTKVELFDKDGNKIGEATAGTDGKATITPTVDIPAGNVTATATKDGQTSDASDPMVATATPAKPSKPVVDTDLTGKAGTKDPVVVTADPGTKVELFDKDGNKIGEATAGTDGKATITPTVDIPAGNVTATATKDGQTSDASDPMVATATPAKPSKPVVDTDLTGKAGTKDPVVVTADPGTKVELFDKDGNKIGEATAGTDGKATITPTVDIPAGNVTATATKDGQTSDASDPMVATATPAKPSKPVVDTDLTGKAGTKDPVVVTADPGTKVELFDKDGNKIGEATAGTDGKATITPTVDIPAGNVTATATKDGQTSDASDPMVATATPAKPSKPVVDTDLTGKAGTKDPVVVTADPGTKVELFDKDGNKIGEATAGTDGKATITPTVDIPAGNVTATATKDGQTSDASDPMVATATPAKPSKPVVDTDLTGKAGTKDPVVVTADPGTKVELFDKDGNKIGEATAGTDGKATITPTVDIPAGNVTATATKDGQTSDASDPMVATKDPAITPVVNPSALTDAEKAKVADEVKKANPTASKVEVGNDGTATVTFPDGSVAVLTPAKTVKEADSNGVKDPKAKTPVKDPANLTDAEKAKVADEVKKANPTASKVEVGNDGTATVTFPDGSTATVTPDKTVKEADSNGVKDPKAKTPVKDPANLTDAEKAKVADEVKKANPTATNVEVGKDGTTTVTFPDGSTATVTPDKTVKEADSNGVKDPKAKTPVKDPANLTDAEKAKVADEVKKANPTATNVEVGKDGTTTVTFPDGSTATVTPDKTVKEADSNGVKDPEAKTPVKDPANLTDAEKAKVADEVKKANPTAKDIKVNNDGSVVVTFADGSVAVIASEKAVKEATKESSANPSAKKAGAKELPNTGTEQSNASLALALLAAATGGLLIAKKRKEEE